ncbi:MAG: TetR/AcrR family transcriptional regulator [Thermodesulfobacteriota bacterium]
MSERRAAILAAATRLFAERGYDGAPVSEIAREAGVSEAAVFRLFSTKENLLAAIFREVRETFFADMEREYRFRPEDPGMVAALRLVRLYCRFYEKRETAFDFVHRNNPYQMPGVGESCREDIRRIHDKMLEQLTVGLALGVRDGSVRMVPAEKAAYLVLSLISGAVRMRLFTGRSLADLEEELLLFVNAALVPHPAEPPAAG